MTASQAPQRRNWVRLDNAANIFVAARTDVDTKVFRLAAELDEQVDPAVLQEALDRVYAQYPMFRAVLRKGVFWYYLQHSGLHPQVMADEEPSVQHIYHHDRRELLFRVLYRGNRISLEVFHALTDGTGALWFFQDLLTEYVGLRHTHEFEQAAPLPAGVKQEFAVDAFTHWFRSGTGVVPFDEDAAPAVEARSTKLPEITAEHVDEPSRRKIPSNRVVSLGGTHTPDNRSRVVELSMPASQVLTMARGEGVSMTIYLLAVFFDALRQARPPAGKARTMTCSVPVNLRQFFPTESGRNFFATTMLSHTWGPERVDSIGEVCRGLDAQFKKVLSREGLERKIRRLIRFERNPALRIVPRPLKDVILRVTNSLMNRGITVAISNLGRVTFPDPVAAHVGRVYLHVSAVRPQFCVVSHGDLLTISFTSPYVETDYLARFVRHFTEQGVPVEVNANRVTGEEIVAVEQELPQ